MESLYYGEITLIIIFAAIIMISIIMNNSLFSKSKKNSSIILYILLILSVIFEWLSVFLNGKPSNTILLHGFIKAIEYSIIPFFCIQFAVILDTKKISKWVLALLAINIIFQFTSIGTKLSFYIDENNFYQHGICHWIYMVIWFTCCLYAVGKCFIYGSRFQTRSKIIPLMILILAITGVVLRQINNDVRLEMLCLGLSSIFIYVYYAEIIQKSDALTGLLNRGSYIGKTSNLSDKTSIIYFDIDEFKSCNDTYGHDYGDKILCLVGHNIKEVYSRYGLCYRIGGDEFCVILEKELDNIEFINDKFKEKMNESQVEMEQKISVSFGYALFDPQKDSIEDTVRLADKNMYRTKEKLRTELAKTNEKLYVTIRAFQIAAQASSSLVFIYDLKNQSIIVDERTAKAFGVKQFQEGIPYQMVDEGIISEETIGEYVRLHEEMLHGAAQTKGIVELIQADGSKSVQQLSLIAIYNEDGSKTDTAVGVYSVVDNK